MAQEPVRLRETFQKFWTKDKTESLLSILEAQEWDKNIYFLKNEFILAFIGLSEIIPEVAFLDNTKRKTTLRAIDF